MSDLDKRKQLGSVDSVMDQRMNVLVDIVDTKLNEVYRDFNLAMEAKNKQDKRTEAQLANMVQVLWGLLNEQKIRLITLEDFIVKAGVGSGEELERLYLENISKFKQESGFEEIPLEHAVGVNPLDSVDVNDPDIKPF